MCGSRSGHHGAIALQWRSPSEEVVKVAATEADHWQTWLIVFGLLGVAIGAFHWSSSPWFVAAKQAIATWLIDRDIFWPLADNAPWWVLTHYPDQNDVFTWLDGALLLGYVGVTALVWGSVTLALLASSVRRAGPWRTQRLHHLAQALIPVAGIGVFLGLSAITLTLLRGEGIVLHWINPLRLALLVAASAWSLALAWQIAPYVVLTLGEVLLSATALEFAYSQATTAMKGVIMAFWYLTSTFGSLWVLLTNVAVRNEAVTARIAATGYSENAFLMFFFALFAFVAALAFAAYARTYPMQDNYRAA